MRKSCTTMALGLVTTLAVGWFNPGCMLGQDSCDNALPDYEVSQAELEQRIPENMGTFLFEDAQGTAKLTLENPQIVEQSPWTWRLFASRTAMACSWDPPSTWVDVEATLRWQPAGQAEVVVFERELKRIEFSGVGRPTNQNLISAYYEDPSSQGGAHFSIRTDLPSRRHLIRFGHEGRTIALGYD